MVDLKQALNFIDPSSLEYSEWLSVGMGLKSAANDGFNVSWQDWDEWSRRDPARYQSGICEKKWHSFNSSGINKATIVFYAMENGFEPFNGIQSLDWEDVIDDGIPPNEDRDFLIYIKSLFDKEDLVSIVTKSFLNENGKYSPGNSGFTKTAKQLETDFIQYKGDLEQVIGDYNHDAGVWVRMNPTDGQGVSNTNITKFKYTLIESDVTDVETQLKTILELRLPCAAIVNSGGKSVHAVVKINAEDQEEYKKRVEYLHKVLLAKNFPIDKQNKNPSRLSRLPGVDRDKERQYLIDINTGYSDFATWKEYVENGFNEIELPEIKSFKEYSENMPELAPELIKGVLRQGHKMLLAGSSKAGKSFCLIELAIALAEGKTWFGFLCKKSKVLYINLEIDEASFVHRVDKVYEGMHLTKENTENLMIWSLRGKAQPMHKLTPKIIERIQPENYDVIILDPVYKVQSGDENAAGDIAAFTNQFDKLTTELGVSLIYCHHHSKGNQGGKRAIDRASGSGVFARDPDAILDMIELDNETYKTNEKYRFCSAWRIEGTLREFAPFEPVNVFFNFPVHEVDHFGLLDEAEVRDYSVKDNRSKKEEKKMEEFDIAFESLTDDGKTASEKDMRNFFGVGEQAFRKRLNQYNKCANKVTYTRFKGVVTRKE